MDFRENFLLWSNRNLGIRGRVNIVLLVPTDGTDLIRPREAAVSKHSGKSVKLVKQRSSSKLRKHSSTDLTPPTAIGGRDNPLFLFRALGKILYCKSECVVLVLFNSILTK